ncbi:ADP-ribosylation factor-like protein 4C isoform X2 [Babylonia areolata]|uniref:ADP-ribosylation factor-like protein 4C isoform X2 n=1 Tax=Babylonia areolata TaxID=304850 RepID=UPI003FD0C428
MGSSSSVQKLVLVGLENSGKTTLLYHLKFGQYVHTIPTVGFNCEKVEGGWGRAKGVTFCLWDLEGKDNKRPLWNTYLRSAHGIIFVVDSRDRERLDEARMELQKLVKGQQQHCLPILVLANKQDLQDALTAREVGEALAVPELSRGQQLDVLPVCAVTGEGLAEAMDHMADMVRHWKKGKGGGGGSGGGGKHGR